MAKSRYNVWSKPNTPEPPPEGHGERSAAHRLTLGEYCFIDHAPKFQFDADTSFFTIGSCFVQHIAKSLTDRNYEILTNRLIIDTSHFPDPQYHYENDCALIKFTPLSMLNEIQVNVEGRDLPDNGLIDLQNGTYWNPQLHKIKPTTLERHAEVQRRVRETVASIVEADVVFITLGLTETWIDTKLGIALNENPLVIRELRRGDFKDRFEFKNVGYDESLETMEELLATVRKRSQKDVKFIVTVSPIPLVRTFTGMDVIPANTYSKSVLRVVAQTLADKYDWVDYFPSFEIVTNSPRELAWRHNQRHVQDEMIDYVMQTFLNLYLK